MLPYPELDGVANPVQPQSKRCTPDLPGFKNLEGLAIACFSPNDSPQTLAYKDERRAWKRCRHFLYLSWL